MALYMEEVTLNTQHTSTTVDDKILYSSNGYYHVFPYVWAMNINDLAIDRKASLWFCIAMGKHCHTMGS